VGRALSVYLLVPVSNVLTEKIPLRWQHVIVWGGLRGPLALSLTLSLDSRFPDRARVLDLTFGVVVFFYTVLRDAIHEFFRHRAEVYRQSLWELFRVGRTSHVSS